MPLIPGLSAGLVQDYLQRSRVQYNIINNILLGKLLTTLALCYIVWRIKIYEFNLDWCDYWSNSR